MTAKTILHESRAIDPLCEPIVLRLSETERSVRIDLNQLFGARGLTFLMAIEDPEFVEGALASVRGMLFLTPNNAPVRRTKTRLAVRATDREGEGVSITLPITVEPSDLPLNRAA